MRQKLWWDSTEQEVDELLNSRDPGILILVAERDGGGLAGFAEVGLRKFAGGCSTTPVAYLEGIWVDPDRRRGGIASELVRHAEDWARDLGLSELASDSEIDNAGSRSFHHAAGFEETHRTIHFRRDLNLDSP